MATPVKPQVEDKTPEPVGEEAFQTSFGSDETALVPVDGDAPTIQMARVYTDAPVFDQSEISLPRLRLAQGLTQEVSEGSARPGEWVLLGNEAQKEVTFVPVQFNRHRELWVRAENKTLCSSGDAVTGVGTPGGSCATCPMGKWTPSKTNPDRNDPPPCKVGYSYVGYSLTHGAVVELTLRSSNKANQTACQYINTLIQNLGLGRFAVNLGSEPTKNPGGNTYFGPVVRKTVATPEDLAAAREALSGDVE